MGLFRRGETDASGQPRQKVPEVHAIVGRQVFCRVCEKSQPFTRCWRRAVMQRQCTACGMMFDSPGALYKKFQPKCPKCEEPLEQPGFDYGLCDGCGSKYEIVEGTKPGLLPNKRQRAEMDRIGRMRGHD